MRWSRFLIFSLVILFIPNVIALNIDCPPSADVNSEFGITVSHVGATSVKLYHHGQWDQRQGQSATFYIQESDPQDKTYYGGAYVSNNWIEGASYSCIVSIIQREDSPGNLELSANPSSVVSGGSTTLTVSFIDYDGVWYVDLIRGGTTIKTQQCSGTSCQFSFSDSPTSAVTYTARGYDQNANLASATAYVTVTNPAPTISGFSASPTSIQKGSSVRFTGSVSDSDISSATIFYGDGSSEPLPCSSTSCTIDKSRTYPNSGSFSAYVRATDAQGQTTQSSTITITVTAPSDADGDSVPDNQDTCANTQAGDQAVTSGTYLGCSCNQIVNKIPNPTDDQQVCTDDLCSIVNGAFVRSNPPKATGSQPVGYIDACQSTSYVDYYCSSGAVQSTTTPNHPSCCTPTCNYATTCSESVSNGCGGTCTRSTTNNICTASNGQPGSCQGGQCECTATDPIYPSTCATSTTNNCGQTVTRSTNGNDCTVNNLAGTCSSGTCVPRCASLGGACGSLPTGATQINAYCPSGLCYQCPSGTFASNGACVQCTASDLSRCALLPSQSPTCNIPVCNSGVCGTSNSTKEGLSCGADGQVCRSGECKGCTTTCAPVILTTEARTQVGCTIVIDTMQSTTTSVCRSATCTPTGTTTAKIGTRNETAQNGAVCPEGTCFNGACLNSTCYAVQTNSFNLDWTPYFSQCKGTATICNTTFTNSNFINHACTNKTAGVCKSEGFCLQKCPVDAAMPGCMINAPSFAIDNGLACQSGYCYECEKGYVWQNSECKPTDYTLTLRHASASANTPVTIIPELRNKQGVIQTNSDHRYTFLLNVPGMSIQPSKDSFTVTFPEPGDYRITGSAQLITGTQIASTPGLITITCPANNPCCPQNSNAYSPEGTACYQGKDAGICQNKLCVTSCQKTGAEICDNNRDDDCNGLADCRDSACSSACGGLICDQGETVCNNQCTNTQSSSLNCGACNNRCGSTEQCIQGSCTAVQGCDVICNSDSNCGRGMICINPGSCTNSYCKPANAVQTTPENVQEIMSQYTKTYSITSEIRGNRLLIRINNLAPVTLTNFNLTVSIPKEVAETASSLGADHAFLIIQEDPVIMFPFAAVNAQQEVTIDLPKAVDPAYARNVQATGSHDPLGAPTILQDEITITSTMLKENGRSKLLLGIDPHAKLYGVRVPVQIPKCIAASVKDLKISGDYEVIQDDPLVVWTFGSLTSKQSIEIEVGGDVSENCKNQLTAFAVADTIDKPVNPWIPLLLIPIIGVLIVFFQRFHSGGAQEHLSRREFERLAKEQGQSQKEIEESWREYERKF